MLLLLRRWLKFNAVGAMGIFVQLAALAALVDLFHTGYLVATAAAVEAAVLHNFLWHERWTWMDRTRGQEDFGLLLARLLRFNVSTGLVSIASNLILMHVLAGQFGIHYLLANVLTIATCALANFLLSELFVFRRVQ